MKRETYSATTSISQDTESIHKRSKNERCSWDNIWKFSIKMKIYMTFFSYFYFFQNISNVSKEFAFIFYLLFVRASPFSNFIYKTENLIKFLFLYSKNVHFFVDGKGVLDSHTRIVLGTLRGLIDGKMG